MNSAQNSTLVSLNVSTMSTASRNRTRQEALDTMKTHIGHAERQLTEFLEYFVRDSSSPFPHPLFPAAVAEGTELKLKDVVRCFDATTCAGVIEKMRDKVHAAYEMQKDYLKVHFTS